MGPSLEQKRRPEYSYARAALSRGSIDSAITALADDMDVAVRQHVQTHPHPPAHRSGTAHSTIPNSGSQDHSDLLRCRSSPRPLSCHAWHDKGGKPGCNSHVKLLSPQMGNGSVPQQRPGGYGGPTSSGGGGPQQNGITKELPPSAFEGGPWPGSNPPVQRLSSSVRCHFGCACSHRSASTVNSRVAYCKSPTRVPMLMLPVLLQ